MSFMRQALFLDCENMAVNITERNLFLLEAGGERQKISKINLMRLCELSLKAFI